MKTVLAVVVVLLVAALVCVPAMAAPAKGDRGAKIAEKARERSPLLKALDANADGVIDAQEIANAPAALKTLDANGDGKLEPAEYRGARPAGTAGHAKPAAQQGAGAEKASHEMPLVAALDANGDHTIDAQEIANAAASLKTLDKNGDGKLEVREYMPHRKRGETAAAAR
jgi:hypothetical protein